MHRGFPYLSVLTIHSIVFMVAHCCVQATPTSIGPFTFNSTSVADTSTIWFNSHLTNVTGATGPVTIYFQNQHVTLFTGQGLNLTYVLNLPNAEVTIDSGIGSPSTSFNTGTSTWNTSVTSAASNPFLAAYAWDVPTGENPKFASAITWDGDFYASQSGVDVTWQWSAAAYTSFSTDYTSLDVTPIDGHNGYANSGTPENETASVTAGAKGNGLPNYTGTFAGQRTESDISLVVVPEPGSALLVVLAGCVTLILHRNPPLSKPTLSNLS